MTMVDGFPSERVLPFAALVGQAELKLALLLAAVNPKLGGVLVRGHKGTAKSTAARGLASLLPPRRVNDGCRFGCPAERRDAWCSECRERQPARAVERPAPFVTVPLGVTEDQLLGSLDIERALQAGEQRFLPGLLADVNGGVLYVDEVNLLDDHIVDLLLDSAAMGVNVVAREGVSISHPAEFLLVGTMNPEEGELRPQLLDRFGLCVEIRSVYEPELRAEIVSRSLAFEADPSAFHAEWKPEQQAVTERISAARGLLARIQPSAADCLAAARIALALDVHGHRADILLVKSAATLAALEGRTELCHADLEQAATVVLPHRLRRQPFEERPADPSELRERAREALEDAPANAQPDDSKKKKRARVAPSRTVTEAVALEPRRALTIGRHRQARSVELATGTGSRRSLVRVTAQPAGLLTEGIWGADPPEATLDAAVDQAPGTTSPATGVVTAASVDPHRTSSDATSRARALRAVTSDKPYVGRYIGAVPSCRTARDLAFDAMLRHAARRAAGSDPQSARVPVRFGPDDLLRKKRHRRPGRLLLLLVDISGSMGGTLMSLARQLALAALYRAYLDRDRVAMIAFRARSAVVLFGPTNQIESVNQSLRTLPLGSTTPLAAGLQRAHELLARSRARDSSERQRLVLISDGRANVGARPGYGRVLAEVEAAARALARAAGLHVAFLDTTEPGANDFAARRLATQLGAQRIRLGRLTTPLPEAILASLAAWP